DKVLDACFKNQPVEYKIIEKTIVLKLREMVVVNRELTRVTSLNPAPPREVHGIVKDESGKIVSGASVAIKGTPRGVATNPEGFFRIMVGENDKVLVVSFVGYKRQEVAIRDRTDINIVLEEMPAQIGEVVITGIFTRKAATYTGAATTVTAKELQQFGNRNLITSLRNVDPSFNIIESNTFGSDPNRLPEIQIRGNSSLPNVTQLQDQTRVGLNTPLVILDGFESTLQKLLDINANEVESITILKDASATSIYGSRGANGVVVITTRPPRPGKLRISYRGDLNVEVPDLTGYHVLDARSKLDLEQKVGLYITPRAENQVPLTRYYNFLLNEVNSGVNTYWLSQPLTTATDQRHNLRLEGGDQVFRYSASAQINDVKGVMKGSYRKNFNGTINLTYYYRNIKFQNSLLVGITNTANSPYGTFSDYVSMNPYWRLYDSSGKLNKLMGNPGNTDYTSRWSTLPTNPMYNATLNTFDKTNSTALTNNTSVEWAVTRDLQFRARLGLTKITDQSDKFRPADHTAFANYSAADVFRKGDYAYGVGNTFNYDGSLSVNYTKLFAQKHSVFAGVDYNIRQNKNSTYSFLAEGFSNPNFDFISTALQYAQNGKPSGTESLTRAVGITANVNYSYMNRYFVDASFREDGASQFGSNKRFAPFWSTGIGWNMDKEAFLKDAWFINRLKLRGSLGITGSQNFSSYQALSTYQYYTADRYYNWMGAYLLGIGNPDLQWQQKMNYDIGIETQLFRQWVSITADYYIGTTNNLVSSVNLPSSNGFTSYIENIGSMENRGFEVKASVFLVRNTRRNFSWSVTAAFFQNRNKIKKISQALKDAQK
ncbi:MAG TPA: SusC/RagA family TonB-linked outer membrane protein, partial [Chitinophagaceae bacterium]|nr:SusC/RagA family TonB-linked outer membrane protein [Chitinophagaceae bacterium]